MLRHGVFIVFMVVLMYTTYSIVGEPHTDHLGFYIGQFLMDLYIVCGIFCLLPPRLSKIAKYSFYTVSYIVCFVEGFIYLRFFLAFSPTMLNLVMETNGGESSEFLRSCINSPKFTKALWIYGSILFCNIILGRWGHAWYVSLYQWLLKKHHVTDLTTQNAFSRAVIAAEDWVGPAPVNLARRIKHALGRFFRSLFFPLAALILIVTTFVPWCGEKWKMIDFMTITETTQAEKITGNVFYSPFYRIIYSIKFVQVVHLDTERLIIRMEDFREHDKLTAARDSIQTADSLAKTEPTCPNIVLVIGESYNKHHASCYGYPLKTTPIADKLERRGELTVFTDAVTPWNVTSNAFKNFLSTHSTDQPGTWTDGVLFPAVFKKAGYRVAFITNQFYKSHRQNRSDFNGSFFLNDDRLDDLCFDFRNSKHFKYDGPLLSELTHYLMQDDTQKASHNLCIVHFMGQHVMYDLRCPDKERVFTVDDIHRDDLTKSQKQIVADYDNATLYNDKTFGRLIAQFKRKDAIVIYLADHGDEVYDGNIGMYGRNHTADLTPQVLSGEFEVPMMIWTSRKFRQSHPAMARAIRVAADRPFSTDDLPHLLFGLAGINSEYYNAKRDLLSPTFTPRKRPIKELVDYDEVMKGKKKKVSAK